MKRKALGRGLSALIPQQGAPAAKEQASSKDFFNCPIERIRPFSRQPRQRFPEQALAELAESIRAQGVIQALVVRPDDSGDQFVLIAGERRWRAAQRAGLKEVPVVIHKVSASQAMEMSLVENLQREDLDPLEEAEALGLMLEEHGYTQEQLAARLGRDRSTIANSLRLRKLPGPAQDALVAGTISAGHARALLGLDQRDVQLQVLKKIISTGLSVRQTEALVKQVKAGARARQTKEKPGVSANVRALEERLARSLRTRVRVHQGKGNKGKLEISYSSLDELDRLLEVLLED